MTVTRRFSLQHKKRGQAGEYNFMAPWMLGACSFGLKVTIASAPYNSIAALFSHAIASTLSCSKRWKVLSVDKECSKERAVDNFHTVKCNAIPAMYFLLSTERRSSCFHKQLLIVKHLLSSDSVSRHRQVICRSLLPTVMCGCRK